MYCQNCGKKLNDDAKFCDGCGAKAGATNTHTTTLTNGVIHESVMFTHITTIDGHHTAFLSW